MFSEWTLVSASIPSGNYLQTQCLSYADHSKFWGAGVGLFPGVREGRMLLYLQCFVGVSGSKDFHHLREITYKYIQPLLFSYSHSFFYGILVLVCEFVLLCDQNISSHCILVLFCFFFS